MQSHKHSGAQNWLLRYGLPCAPAAVCAYSVSGALALSLAFALITFFTALLSALIPRRLPFSLRVVLYSVIGSLVYVPAAILIQQWFPAFDGEIYLPLLAGTLLLTAEHDRFIPQTDFFRALTVQIFGCCGVMLVFGVLRELLGSGTFWQISLLKTPPLPFLLTPSGGILLLVCSAAGSQDLLQTHQKGAGA